MSIRKKEFWKTPEGTAVIAACLAGLFAHLFGLVTVIYNYDNITEPFYGSGSSMYSGRWMLHFIGKLLEWSGLAHNLPMLGGLGFILLIAISSGFVVSIFQIRSRFSAALFGMMFTVFPTIVATMYFRYTIIHYGTGILLAVLAVWILPKHKLALPVSVFFIAASMGIYQAHAPLTITLFVVQLLQKCMDNSTPPPRNYPAWIV